MRIFRLCRSAPSVIVMLGAVFVVSATASAQTPTKPNAQDTSHGCPRDDSGLKLPAGFCATIFADGVGHARHLVVAPNGVVYVNTWSGRYYGNDTPHAGGSLVALQDTTGSGKANVNQRFGETVQSGGAGGTGIGIYKGALFAEINDKIVRYTLTAGSIVPQGSAVTIVSGLPLGGDHPMHPFAIDDDGSLYVDVASATNACQVKNRIPKSPGIDPCNELETRGGIWRYDANKTNQKFSPAERFATGIRNTDGFAIDAKGSHLFVTQHGRDQLHTNWPDLYKPDEEATLPAEELLLLTRGGEITGASRAPPVGLGSRPRWVALRLRRCARTDLPNRVQRRVGQRERRCAVHSVSQRIGAGRQYQRGGRQAAGRYSSGCRRR